MHQGIRFAIAAVGWTALYWASTLYIDQQIVGELIGEFRAVMAAAVAVLFAPLALRAIRSPVFGDRQAFWVSIFSISTSLAAIGGYGALARQYGWPMTAASSEFLGFWVWVMGIAMLLLAMSMLHGAGRLILVGAGAAAIAMAAFFIVR